MLKITIHCVNYFQNKYTLINLTTTPTMKEHSTWMIYTHTRSTRHNNILTSKLAQIIQQKWEEMLLLKMQQTARFRLYVQRKKMKEKRQSIDREREAKKNTRIHQMGRTSEWINSKRAANTGEEMQVFSLLLIVYIVNNVVCAVHWITCWLLWSALKPIIGLAVNYLSSNWMPMWVQNVHHIHFINMDLCIFTVNLFKFFLLTATVTNDTDTKYWSSVWVHQRALEFYSKWI